MTTLVSTTRKQLPTFAICYSLAAAVQLLGLHFANLFATTGLFAGIATILYFVISVAASRVADSSGWSSTPMHWWGAQLVLGLAWTMLFFTGQYVAALPIAFATAIVAAMAAWQFWRTDRMAGLLMAPMLAWLAVAIHLTAVMVIAH